MHRLISLTMLLLGAAGYSLAGGVASPEIDPSSAVAAVTLLSGGLLVLRSRPRRQ